MTIISIHDLRVTEFPPFKPIPTQRPRRVEALGAALVGGLAGGTLGHLASERKDDPAGLLLGAALGGIFGAILAPPPGPLTLRQSLETELANRGLTFVSIRRAGPYKASLAYRDPKGHVWIVDSEADTNEPWTQEKLDDWLFFELVSAVVAEMGVSHAP